jgi:hypothetical protein
MKSATDANARSVLRGISHCGGKRKSIDGSFARLQRKAKHSLPSRTCSGGLADRGRAAGMLA